ncbi:MAG: DNA polymerase Y family protein, partial [Planctomycetes bacterium]|nr:DNA polymerase Y family protein [Planctomycetota bacterium]
MKRVLCLYLPFLSTDRLPRRDSVPAPDPSALSCGTADPIPVATITPSSVSGASTERQNARRSPRTKSQTLRIVHVNQAALDMRIHPGQTLADAKAIATHLVTHDDDPVADRCQLESLAIGAGRLSPVVHIESSDTLFVDVTGCERLFDGEEKLLNQAIDGLRVRGFFVRAAIADTPGTAWAVAHTHSEPATIVPSGQSAEYLAPLPTRSLRIVDQTISALASVGVKTVGSLLYLPRSSLVSRFGDSVLARIDQALGDMPEVLTPYRPPQVLVSRFDLGAATTRLDLLTEATCRTLESFCEKLKRQVAGVRQMFVTFHCPEVSRDVTLEVNLSEPTRSVSHLRSLLMILLDQVRLPAPADSLMLWARRIDRFDDWQGELFVTNAQDARRLGDLLDRLAVRLGSTAVVRPELLSEHEPERAFQYAPVAGVHVAS